MTIYRALDRLSIGVEYGQAFSGNRLTGKNAEILLRKGIITEVDTPPLAIIDSFSEVYEELNDAGIITLGDFLESDIATYDDYKEVGWKLLNSEVGCKYCK